MEQLSSVPDGEPAPPLVRAELDRILASEIFLRSERLSAFLRFIVDTTLSGGGPSLKEHVIAVELYGKGSDFNTAADPIVRVDARRLRDKLREYYASASLSDVVISVPKGSYTPVFERRAAQGALGRAGAAESAAMPAAGVTSRTARGPGRRWGLVLGGGALAAAVIAIVAAVTRSPAPATRLLTVTSFPGAEDDPSLSPDGNFVAFTWAGPKGDVDDLWVSAVEGGGLRRLTSTVDQYEKWPQWAPDGRQIAFTRFGNAPSDVALISPLGGEVQTVGDGFAAGWTPDSRALVMVTGNSKSGFQIVHHALDTGARRSLTVAPPGFRDMVPRVSPDGTTIAFLRSAAGRSAMFLMPANGGEPRLIVEWVSGVIAGLAWMPGGREIVYGRPETSGRHFVRTTIDGRSSSPVSGVPFGSTGATVARTEHGTRLGFASGQVDTGLRLIDLHTAATSSMVIDHVFADATRMDEPGGFSPDGQHVAFVSDRSGSQQVWLSARDGGGLRRLTWFDVATVNVGSFSPDGGSIVLDATVAGNTDVYTVRTDGSQLTRLTDGPAIDMEPEWSRDGRWIYYSSDATGVHTIWKLPATGGAAVQLTTEKGFDPHESPDGQRVYFADQPRVFGRRAVPTVLKEVARAGGRSSVVLPDIAPGVWDVADSGIFFLPSLRGQPLGSSTRETIMKYDFRDRQVRAVGTLAFPLAEAWVDRFFVVSPDGGWALASHVDRFERDIMVLDNFR